MADAEALMLAGTRAHLDLAAGLHAIEPGNAGLGDSLSPYVVDVDHQLGDELVERIAPRARRNRHAPALTDAFGTPVDVERVVGARDVGLAARSCHMPRKL